MSIKELSELLPCPKSPLEVPSEADWTAVEKRLGRLPGDYKTFIERYGTGTIDSFLSIFNPVATNENLNLLHQKEVVLSSLAISSAEFPQSFPMARHPAPGGFLPVGGTDNGDSLFWVTSGDADAWTIAVMGPRAPEVFHFAGPLVDFLIALLSRSLVCDRFPNDFPEDKSTFSA